MFINYKYLWEKLMKELKNGDNDISKYDVLSKMSSLEIKQIDYERDKLKRKAIV